MAKKVNQSNQNSIITNKIYTCHFCGSEGDEKTHKCITLVGYTGRKKVVRRCELCSKK